jgi:hypothetical protein
MKHDTLFQNLSQPYGPLRHGCRFGASASATLPSVFDASYLRYIHIQHDMNGLHSRPGFIAPWWIRGKFDLHVVTFLHRIVWLRSVATSTIMKRSASGSKPAAKKKRIELPEYHSTPSMFDTSGEKIWPAPKDQLASAQTLILEAAKASKRTLIIPDKDTDGLTSGVILYRTLELLGLSTDLIDVHLVKKGNAISSDEERAAITKKKPDYIFVLDQGSRACPP